MICSRVLILTFVIFFLGLAGTLSNVFAEETVTPKEADEKAARAICKRMIDCTGIKDPIEGCIQATVTKFNEEKAKAVKIPKSYLDTCISDFSKMKCETLLKGPPSGEKPCEKLDAMLTPLKQ